MLWKHEWALYFTPIPQILRVEGGDSMMVTLQKVRKNEKGVKQKGDCDGWKIFNIVFPFTEANKSNQYQ